MKLKRKSQKISGNKGITLIVLAITIMVITILATITINTIFSDNGLIRKSQTAKDLAEESIADEEKSVNKLIEGHTDLLIEDEEKLNLPIKVEEAKDGRTFTEKTNVRDGLGNKIVIPAGFKIASDSGYTVEQGIVIEDVSASTDTAVQGSQFVWIPLGKFIKDDGTESNEIVLGRYSFSTSSPGTPTLQQAAYTESNPENYKNSKLIGSYYNEYSGSYRPGGSGTNATAYNLGEWINSAKENGGFYIGRYEASFASGTSLDNYKVATKVSTGFSEASMSYSEGKLWNFIAQPQASEVSINTYESSNSVRSDLINSYAWDTALVYIQECGHTNYANQKGTDINTNLINTGRGQDEVCKINDMASNLLELTTESCSLNNSGGSYTVTARGGDYTYDVHYVSIRNAHKENQGLDHLRF